MTTSKANRPKTAYDDPTWEMFTSPQGWHVAMKTDAFLMHEDMAHETAFVTTCKHPFEISQRNAVISFLHTRWSDTAVETTLNPSKASRADPFAEFKQYYEQELSGLRKQVEKLTSQVAELLAAVHGRNEDETVPQSPHDLWIEQNMDELRRYPNHWIALDAEKGIVIAEEDRERFSERYSKLSADAQDRLLLFHSSMYV